MDRTEEEIRTGLELLVMGDEDVEQFAEEFGPMRVCSFADAGVLTSDEGFTFHLPSGQRVFVTVQVEGGE